MRETTSKVTGFKELNDALKQFPAEIGAKVLRRANYVAAKVVEDAIKAKAPVDTGRLQHFIGRQYGKQADFDTQSKILVGTIVLSKRARKKNLNSDKFWKANLTQDAYYGRFVELGTRFQPARPFAGPATDAVREQYLDELRNTLGSEIERAAQKFGLQIKR